MGNHRQIIVVGAGPAGLMAAIRAAQKGARVTLLEKNAQPGRKLLLSGKGRCNLTNVCDLDEFLSRFSHTGEFLRDAFRLFFHPELMQFFTERGLPLRIERQQRVFPETDSSASVLGVLVDELDRLEVSVHYSVMVENVLLKDAVVSGVLLRDGRQLPAKGVILASGGISYKETGSTGEGLRIAEGVGHKITTLYPALVPLCAQKDICASLQGLTLKNIRVKICCCSGTFTTGVGELLFTHFGISGPLMLSASGKIAAWLSKEPVVLVNIDLKPGLTQEALNNRIMRDVSAHPRSFLQSILQEMLPMRMVAVFAKVAKLDLGKKANQLTQQERWTICQLFKKFPIEVRATLPLEEAMVTSGGVSLRQINPRTMESRLVKGLYFAGEMIDVDADTGGFNLQAAFSTGYLAGESAAA